MRKHLLKALALAAVLLQTGGGYLKAEDGVTTNPTLTDVTSTYIDNAGFETDEATTASVAIESTTHGATISNWTAPTNNTQFFSSAIFSYTTSSYTLGGQSAPTARPTATDSTDTKALGVVAAWSSTAAYTQTAKASLPAGTYVLTAYVYNAAGTKTCTNRFGFVTDGGTSYYGSTTSFTVGSWTTETVTFTLTAETSGTFSVGYVDGGNKSDTSPRLFISGVKLEKYTYTDEALAKDDEIIYGSNTYKVVSGTNLFTNGSFSNFVDGWTAGGYSTAAAISNFTWTATGGSDGGAYLTTTTNGASQATTITQSTNVETGKTYYFKIYTSGKTPSSQDNVQKYNVLFQMSDASTETSVLTYFNWGAAYSSTSDTWTSTEYVFTAETNYVGVRFSWNSSSSFDGVQLYEIELASLDYSELNDAISTAETANTTYNDTDLGNAISTAKAILENTTATQDDVNAGVNTLNQAVAVAKVKYYYNVSTDSYPYASSNSKSAYTTAYANTTAEDYESTVLKALRAMIESNAAAEGVSEAISCDIINPEGSSLTGWTETGNGSLRLNSGGHWTNAAGETSATDTYFDSNAWSTSNWSGTLTQDIKLPIGKYLLSAIARGSTGMTFSLSAKVGESDATTVALPTNGSASGTNYFDYGWDYRYLTFDVTSESDVTIGVTASASGSSQWISFADFKLVRISTGDDAAITSGSEVTVLYLTNPSFESGTTEGWTIADSSDEVGAKSTTSDTYKTTGSVGSYLYNAWHSTAQEETLSQSITLPAGIYVLTAKVAYDHSAQSVTDFVNIYAGETSQAVDAHENTFVTSAVKFTVSADNIAVEIGAKRNGWFKADDFHLFYYSSSDETSAESKLKDSANINEVALSIAAGKHATRIFPFKPVSLPEGVKVYTCGSIEDGTLTLTEVEDPAADTPYLLYSESAVESTTLKDAASAPVSKTYTSGGTDVYLTGVLDTETQVPASGDNTIYALQTQDGVQAFYKVATAFTSTQYRAYLSVAGTSSVRAISIGGDHSATAIEAVEVLDALTSGNAEIYDLNGRKLSKLQKGVNIVNGKKVIVK